ncbi:MAG: hypothetical protein KDA65_05195 [Planctomycetaceae bacterium]|nr:hypothetical protein [Planctomycetaceae bacterium]
MSSVLNVLTSSFPAGSIFHTRIRVAYSLPVFFLLILLKKSDDLLIAASLILIFLASVLFQVLMQLAVVRHSGGEVTEVVLWPLGSLARIQLGFKLNGRLLTWLSVPLSHLLLCLVTLPVMFHIESISSLFSLYSLPVNQFSMEFLSQLGWEFIALAFYINLMLFAINLFPVLPLSLGRVVEELLLGRFSTNSVNRVLHSFTTFFGFTLLLVGVIFSHAWIALFGTILICWTLYEKIRQLETAPARDESELFLGYDFSAGYTSLEQSDELEAPSVARPPSFLTRWKARRRRQQRRKAAARLQAAQEQIDLLLKKVSETGLSSLTAAEYKQLKQASQHVRPQKSK